MRKIKIKRKESTERVGSARSGAKSGVGVVKAGETTKLSPGGGPVHVIPTKMIKMQNNEVSSNRFKETKQTVVGGSSEKQNPTRLKI